MRFKVKSGNFVLLGYNDVDSYIAGEHNPTNISYLFDINQVTLIDNIPLCHHNRYYKLCFKGQPGIVNNWNKNWVILLFEGNKFKQCLSSALTWHKNSVD